MTRRDLPNLISILRACLVLPVVWLLAEGKFFTALIIFAVAGFTDALDGFLAKRYHWSSSLGALLDPLADKILLVFSYLTLGILGLIPFWLVMLVILRDIVIVAGAISYHLRVENLEAAPTFVSKLNTFVQILLVFAVVFSEGLLALPELWIDILVYSVLATTLLSGLDYVWTWGWRAWNSKDIYS